MIQVNHLKINNIPVLEIVDDQLKQEKLPLVVFFHGWTNVKEAAMVNGYELARRGMRAVLPEAYKHGERDPEGTATDNHLIFWEVVSQNVRELKNLVRYFTDKKLADENRIGVTGLSMGGITTCAALTQYDWIKAAVCLMGNPAPVEFTEWMLKTENPSDFNEEDLLKHPELDFETKMNALKTMALNEKPEKIAGRPLHFWHGTQDDVVPFDMTEKFVEKSQKEPYGANISFSVGEGKGHKVPYAVSVEMADFFKEKL